MQGVSLWAFALVVLSTIDISSQDEVDLDCQPGWTLMGVQCFKLYQGIVPWESAAKVCKSYGGELAKVTDYTENQEVGMFAVGQNINKYWIGYSRYKISGFTRTEASAGNQVIGYWSDGDETSIAAGFWENDQPNDDEGKCVSVMEKGSRYFWSFGPCEAKMPYICQRPACPADSHHCVNGRCINPSLKCDGEDDCGDSSDEMDCAGYCSFYRDQQSGSITSTNYPSNYADASSCIWVIKVPLGQNAYLRFTNFTTESDNDIVQVLVGGLTETRAMVVGTHSGDLSRNLPEYTSQNNFIIVKFSSDSATNGRGFRADFSGRTANLPPVQYLTATDSMGTLRSPNYPTSYLGCQDYTWIINTQRQTQIITLNILDVDLKGEDMILIRDGSSVEDNLLYRFKADTDVADVPYLFSTGTSIYITMQTRGFMVGKGFEIMYKQGCEMSLTAMRGHIFSPGYALSTEYDGTNYPNQIECTYMVNVPGNPMLTLKYSTLVTQANTDLVKVHWGGASPDILSGSVGAIAQRQNTGHFNITFITDAIIRMKGFSFMYSVDCPDPNFNDKTVITPSSATWQFGSFFTVTCMDGYRFASQEYQDLSVTTGFVSVKSMSMECLSGGKWNQRTTPNCKPMYCGPAPPVVNAYVNSSIGQASSVGGSVTYECYPGFTRAGSAVVACRNDGTWGPTPSCTIASCPALSSNIAFGNSTNTEGDGTEFGSIVTFTCNDGYQIVGEPILFCTSSSTWTSSVPSCTKKNCPEPAILYGKLNDQTMAYFGDSRSVECEVGYELTGGTNPVICGPDQMFTNLAAMKCEDRDECTISGTCSQDCMNTMGSYTCSCGSNFTLSPNGRTCDDIRECSTSNNGGCSQNCVEATGGYSCTCNSGYELFTSNGQLNYTIPSGENGHAEGDIYRLQHTCVRIQCADPPELVNGYILTDRQYHRYEDYIIMMCKIGYNLIGSSVRECQANGQWSGTAPSCSSATCPADSISGNLITPPTVTPSGAVNYMSHVNITCNVPGRAQFVKQRQCLLDPDTKTYHLYGSQYECGVIDCGTPTGVPGAIIPANVQTVFGSSFNFACRNLYTKEGTSSSSDDTVSCKANGYWGWGTLRCIGLTCTDPGRPVDGTQHATTYEEGMKVNYTCDRPGYTIVGNPVLTCVVNVAGTSLDWDHSVPTCADTQAPTFSNCVNESIVSKYTAASVAVTVPTAIDNTAVKSMNITPTWPSSSYVISEDQMFIFEAEDFNGNKASCTVNIRIKDEIPPAVTCPGPLSLSFTESSDYSHIVFDATTHGVTATDNSGDTPTVTFSPQSVNMTGTRVGQPNYKEWIYATARDSSGNENTCRFQVIVAAAPCSPMSLPTPVHGQKSCEAKAGNTGYTCNLTCDVNYAFHDQSPQAVVSTSCSTNGPFDLPSAIPACSFTLSETARYTQVLNFVYTADGSSDLTDSCRADFASAVGDVLTQVVALLPTYCGNLRPRPIPTITFQNVDPLNDITINNVTKTVSIDYNLVYETATTTNLQSCATLVLNVLSDNNFEETRRLTGEFSAIKPLSCPRITASQGTASKVFQDFSCQNGRKLVESDSNRYCLLCPKGTYNSAGSTCTPCPLGQFSNIEGATQCQECPQNTWTYKTGAAEQTTCKPMCVAGSTSPSRLPPCTACRLNSYWVNSTYCQSCPSGSITRDVGTTLASECKAECQVGTFSAIDGHEGCNQCPMNFYQDLTGQTTCKECASTQVTANVGSQSLVNCTDGSAVCSGFCQRGTCSLVRHSPTCSCPDGFSGEKCEVSRDPCASSPCYNGGTCSRSGANFTCNCPAGTSGPMCSTDLNDCPEPLTAANNPCQNGGMCQDQLNRYMCLCKDGFTGSLCSSPQPICESQPCINGACDPIGSFRRECNCSGGYTGPDCNTNINECAENPCLHGGTCTDQVNGYTCRCRIGFTGSRCETRLNKCDGVTCGFRGTCVEDHLEDTYRCVCNPDAAYGEVCDYIPYLNVKLKDLTFSQNVTSPQPVTLATCKQACDSQGCGAFSFFSIDQSCLLHSTRSGELPVETQPSASYYVKKCSYVKDDFFTEWLNTPDVTRTSGNYLSINYMRNTLQLDICGGTAPLDIECRDAVTKQPSTNAGIQCSVQNGFTCDNSAQTPSGSTCNMHEVRFKCAVARVLEENTCVVPPYCDSSPCVNGACRTEGLSFVCDCNPGYGGSLCQNDLDDCASNPCLNGGTCTDDVNEFSCACDSGYTGSTCADRIDYCSTGPCNITGSVNCTNGLTEAQCFCRPGYSNPSCSFNIQECLSNPCLHNGDCTDAINGFVCSCKPGWTGDRCETLITSCNPTSPCQNSAACHNLFGNYFCRCNANTYGQNCENAPSVCGSANPCVHGTCTESSGVTTCNCGSNYTGVGCEIQIEHCDANTCQNKAKCSSPSLDTYQCSCPLGFDGRNCDMNINDCAGVVCPGDGTCIDGVNEYFCRCPVGKTGSDCSRVLDRNYDMLFELTQKTSHASLPYPIRVNTNKLSVSLWVRFWSKDDTGTFFSMYTVDGPNSLSSKKELMRMDHTGLTISIGGTARTVTPNGVRYNDGKWYQITVTWNGETGMLRFVVNTISKTIQNYQTGNILDTHVWMVLGSRYDPVKEKPVMYEGFNGWLSQVSLYERDLTFEQEIPLKLEQPKMFFNEEIFAWNEFRRSGGVSIAIPSTAKSTSCLRGYSGPACATPNDRKLVVYPLDDTCPRDIIVLGSNRITKVTWTDPAFGGSPSTVISTHKSGDVFGWNRFLVVYVASNTAGNKGLCSFKIFVQYTNCTRPSNPYKGTAQESRASSPLITNSIQCNAGYETVRPVPKLFTCPRIGHYNPPKKYNNFKFPPCGSVVQNPLRQVFVQLFYRVTSTYCTGIRTVMKSEILRSIQELNTIWGRGLCSTNDCSDVIILVNCESAGRRKRQSVLDVNANITLPRAKSQVTDGTQLLTPEDVLRLATLSQSRFNFGQAIPNAVSLNDLLMVLSTLSCEEGQTVVDGKCVKCAPGTYYNNETMTCDDCPAGQYQELEGATSCQSCGVKITELSGASSRTDCKDNCPVGRMFDEASNRCIDCPIGFYQNLTGQFFCYPCSVEKTTRSAGSTSTNDCYVGCGRGEQLGPGGTCEKCSKGKYRDASMPKCEDCPQGLTTLTTGASDMDLCNVGDCQIGYFRNNSDPKICEICRLGTYQDEKEQYNCKSCGNSSYDETLTEGADSLTDCKFVCPHGQEAISSQGALACSPCKIGFFRNATITPETLCHPCFEGRSTLNVGAINPDDCSVLKCPVGKQPDVNNTLCENCPLGTYQDVADQQNCKQCNGQTSTRSVGSNSTTDCESFCPGGEEKLDDGSCRMCPVGFYKENSIYKFMMCAKCLDSNTVTESTGTDSASKCTVRSCQPGYKRKTDDSGCDPCPLGSYQPLPYQESCMPCGQQTSTRQNASVNATQCERYCNPGYEKDDSGLCQLCIRGYYKDNAAGLFGNCELCPVQYITSNVGATSISDCSVVNCSAGYKTENNQCVACPVGYYQPEKWQAACEKCPTDKTTVTTGSTALSDCIFLQLCFLQSTSLLIGFYKVEQKAAPCTACRENTTTTITGADSQNDCNIVGCHPGYRRISSTNCEPCPYGFYQPKKWQTSCESCDSGTTTFSRGATTDADCVLDCPKGEQYNSATRACELCPQGSYQDKNNPQFPMCIMCGDPERITPGPGAVSAANCTLQNCTTPGQFLNATINQCQDCPIGTYQNTKWQLSCEKCLSGFTTRTTKSPRASSCVRDCPLGKKQVGDSCIDCGLNFYRDGSTWNCTKCPDDLRTTSVNAASLTDCNVSPCDPGYFFDRPQGSCQPCPKNTYQTEANSFQCEPCPSGKFTTTVGSKNSNDCKGFCGVSSNCSPDAVCEEDPVTQFKCTCKTDFTGNGVNCTHKCDTNYCTSGSTCYRGPPAYCQCTEFYKGDQCALRRLAEEVSDQNTLTIVGIVIGVLGFLLLLILIAACLYRRRNPTPIKRTPSDYDDRTSLARGPYDYPLAYVPSKAASVVSGPRYMLPQTIEKSYDNQLYIASDDDPAVYKA